MNLSKIESDIDLITKSRSAFGRKKRGSKITANQAEAIQVANTLRFVCTMLDRPVPRTLSEILYYGKDQAMDLSRIKEYGFTGQESTYATNLNFTRLPIPNLDLEVQTIFNEDQNQYFGETDSMLRLTRAFIMGGCAHFEEILSGDLIILSVLEHDSQSDYIFTAADLIGLNQVTPVPSLTEYKEQYAFDYDSSAEISIGGDEHWITFTKVSYVGRRSRSPRANEAVAVRALFDLAEYRWSEDAE